MRAIIETNGAQIPVEVDAKCKIPKIDAEVGAVVDFDRVLLVSKKNKPVIGKPYVDVVRQVGVGLIDRSNGIETGVRAIGTDAYVSRGHRGTRLQKGRERMETGIGAISDNGDHPSLLSNIDAIREEGNPRAISTNGRGS